MSPDRDASQDERDDAGPSFEDIVAAALKVDPRGIAGKHRKARERSGDADDER